MASYLAVQTSHAPRRQLRILDRLLDELEDLNLNGMTCVPTRVGGDLQRNGVDDPYRWSISELIDKVFDLQQPVLERLRTDSRTARFR